jgi:hypothetical protein
VLPGFRRVMRAAWGKRDQAMFARFLCIHAGSENPVVRYNATLEQAKSTENTEFPQISWGFVQISPIFTAFYPVFQVLR